MRMQAGNWRRSTSFLYLTAPAVVLYTVFFIWPLVTGLCFSFTNWNGLTRQREFVGLANFGELLKDSGFLSSMSVTVRYAAFVVLVETAAALGLALLLSSKGLRYRSLLRTLFFLPNVMSLVIISVIWAFLFGNVFRGLLTQIGLGEVRFSWLGHPRYAIYSLGLVGVWHDLGFYLIILLAGITTIPPDVLEAAEIDGASRLQQSLRIVLPLLLPTIITCSILSVASSLRAFEIPFVITGGGPGFSTTTVAYFIYRTAFADKRFGYGSAASLYLLIGVAGVTLAQLRIMQRSGVDR